MAPLPLFPEDKHKELEQVMEHKPPIKHKKPEQIKNIPEIEHKKPKPKQLHVKGNRIELEGKDAFTIEIR